jgi:hypothetical protein
MMCYNFPYDLISILTCSVILNFILAFNLARVINERNIAEKLANDMTKLLKKYGKIK